MVEFTTTPEHPTPPMVTVVVPDAVKFIPVTVTWVPVIPKPGDMPNT